jgi:hypothetical protein
MRKATPKKTVPGGNATILIDSPDRDPFARIPHRVLSDRDLSWKAKGILAYLLGKPPNWQTRLADLVNQSRDGRDSALAGLLELRRAGYAARSLTRDRGRITGCQWIISHTPRFKSPFPGFPFPVNPTNSKNEGNKNDGTTNFDKKSALIEHRKRVLADDCGACGHCAECRDREAAA